MIRNLVKSVLALSLGAVAIVVPSTAANAASGVSLTPPATVHGNTAKDCYDASYGYSLALDPSVASWTLAVTVTGPDGSAGVGDFFTESDLTTGTGTESLCPDADPYGTYTMTGTLTTKDASYNTLEAIPTVVTFQYVGPAHSLTQLSVSRHRLYAGHPILMKMRAMRAGRGWANANIRIEMRVYGIWTKVKAGRTGPTGLAILTLMPKKKILNDPVIGGHTFRFRAVTSDTTFTYGDTSASKKVHFG